MAVTERRKVSYGEGRREGRGRVRSWSDEGGRRAKKYQRREGVKEPVQRRVKNVGSVEG